VLRSRRRARGVGRKSVNCRLSTAPDCGSVSEAERTPAP